MAPRSTPDEILDPMDHRFFKPVFVAGSPIPGFVVPVSIIGGLQAQRFPRVQIPQPKGRRKESPPFAGAQIWKAPRLHWIDPDIKAGGVIRGAASAVAAGLAFWPSPFAQSLSPFFSIPAVAGVVIGCGIGIGGAAAIKSLANGGIETLYWSSKKIDQTRNVVVSKISSLLETSLMLLVRSISFLARGVARSGKAAFASVKNRLRSKNSQNRPEPEPSTQTDPLKSCEIEKLEEDSYRVYSRPEVGRIRQSLVEKLMSEQLFRTSLVDANKAVAAENETRRKWLWLHAAGVTLRYAFAPAFGTYVAWKVALAVAVTDSLPTTIGGVVFCAAGSLGIAFGGHKLHAVYEKRMAEPRAATDRSLSKLGMAHTVAAEWHAAVQKHLGSGVPLFHYGERDDDEFRKAWGGKHGVTPEPDSQEPDLNREPDLNSTPDR